MMVLSAQRRGVDASNEFGDFGFSAKGNEISSALSDRENLEHKTPVQRLSQQAVISFLL